MVTGRADRPQVRRRGAPGGQRRHARGSSTGSPPSSTPPGGHPGHPRAAQPRGPDAPAGGGSSELRDPPHEPVTHPRLRGISTQPTPRPSSTRSAGATSWSTSPTTASTPPSCASCRPPRWTPRCWPSSSPSTAPAANRPSVQLLKDAAHRGKQVAVLVEITARFDEAPNIAWGRELEQAGCPRGLRGGAAQDPHQAGPGGA
jgi:hypothetical protein